jgi:uncharacterized protein (TIGR03437 family)
MRASMRVLFVLCFCAFLLPAQIEVSTDTLSFEAIAGGDPPPEQRIYVIASPAGTLTEVALRVEGVPPMLEAPKWLVVAPKSLTMPGAVRVGVDPSTLTAGTQASARILFTKIDGTALGPQVQVTLNVRESAPKLVVTPERLHIYGKATTSAFVESDIVLRNPGGGNVAPVTAEVKGVVSWASVKVMEPCAVECTVRVTTRYGMETGTRRAVVELSTAAGAASLPVALHVSSGEGAILGLEPPTISFEARAGHGLIESRRSLVYIDSDTPTDWIVEKVTGGSWLTLGSTTGTSTRSIPGRVSISANSAALVPGNYYSLLRVSSSSALNSPLYLPVVLRVSDTAAPPIPLLPAGGVTFLATVGGNPPSSLKFPLSTSSATPVQFRASVDHVTGAGWLTVSPTSGSVSSAAPAGINVSTAPLPKGAYTGKIHFSVGNLEIRSLNVTTISSPASGCVPGEMYVTHLGIPDNFKAAVGAHLPLVVSVLNDCGLAVTNAAVTVEFSNGERSLPLRHIGNGVYAAAWSPSKESAVLNLTAVATSSAYRFVSRAMVAGSVTSGGGPVLFADAVLNNLNPLVGAPLAPGTVAQVYGRNLATATVQPGFVNGKLPSSSNGTFVLVGDTQAPLYYLSDGQLNVQLPVELATGREYQALASLNGAWSVPATVFTEPATPGIVVYADSAAVAQHQNYSLVNAASPAHPSEYVRVYLVGMGSTNPAVATGLPAPPQLHRVVKQPDVTLDGAPVTVSYAGLAPGWVGLYQIDFQVPESARSGNLALAIIQDGVPANESYLPVRR